MYDWLMRIRGALLGHICDTTVYLDDAVSAGKNILFEAQLGALRDIDYGIYPIPLLLHPAAYAPSARNSGPETGIRAGDHEGLFQRVGEGPFVCEFFGGEAEKLREAGGEYGAATGRPRRVGAFDAVASRFGVLVQGATELALTKLDVLSYMEKLPICTGYEVDGRVISDFPTGDRLLRAKPSMNTWTGSGPTSQAADASASCRRKRAPMCARWKMPCAAGSAMCPWGPAGRDHSYERPLVPCKVLTLHTRPPEAGGYTDIPRNIMS
jgi:adenylosuccinate synthase